MNCWKRRGGFSLFMPIAMTPRSPSRFNMYCEEDEIDDSGEELQGKEGGIPVTPAVLRFTDESQTRNFQRLWHELSDLVDSGLFEEADHRSDEYLQACTDSKRLDYKLLCQLAARCVKVEATDNQGSTFTCPGPLGEEAVVMHGTKRSRKEAADIYKELLAGKHRFGDAGAMVEKELLELRWGLAECQKK